MTKHSTNWDFPLILPAHPLKRATKVALGQMLLLVRPDIGRRVVANGGARSLVERVAVAGLIARHRAAGTLDKLAHLHSSFWASGDAVHFHGLNEDRFADNFLKKPYEIVPVLEGVLAGGRFHTLCEIGCGSGQVIDHLAAKLPALKKLVGIDLSPGQIAITRERYESPRLSFVAADGADWLRENAAPGFVLWTYGGVLEYFKEAPLRSMFETLAQRAPACVAIVEPIDPAHDLARETRTRVFGKEFTFSHNYPHLLREAGFRIRWQHEVDTGYRWLMVVATAGDA